MKYIVKATQTEKGTGLRYHFFVNTKTNDILRYNNYHFSQTEEKDRDKYLQLISEAVKNMPSETGNGNCRTAVRITGITDDQFNAAYDYAKNENERLKIFQPFTVMAMMSGVESSEIAFVSQIENSGYHLSHDFFVNPETEDVLGCGKRLFEQIKGDIRRSYPCILDAAKNAPSKIELNDSKLILSMHADITAKQFNTAYNYAENETKRLEIFAPFLTNCGVKL